MTKELQPPLSPNDYLKLTPNKIEKYKYYSETEIPRRIKELENTKMLMILALDVEQFRDEIIAEWNGMTPEQHRNVGKSQDEIDNGENAQRRSPVTFERFAECSFKEMPEMFQSMYLTGRVDSFKQEHILVNNH